jgi:hypothetical protein
VACRLKGGEPGRPPRPAMLFAKIGPLIRRSCFSMSSSAALGRSRAKIDTAGSWDLIPRANNVSSRILAASGAPSVIVLV